MSRKIPETITEEELHTILKAANKKSHKIAYLLAFYQGLRISEIVGLKKQISLCCKAEVWKIKEKDKNMVYKCSQCQREITIDQMRRHLTDYQIPKLTMENIDLKENLMMIKGAKGEKDRNIPIAPEIRKFLNQSSLPIKCGPRSLEIAFKLIGKKILNKEVHFHCLRHSGLTHYHNAKKWPIRFVQQFAGHADISTTMIYTHVNPQDLQKIMNGG